MHTIKEKIIQSALFNRVTADLHHRKRRKQLKQTYNQVINKYRNWEVEDAQERASVSDYIWLCWWQGADQMSPLVLECCERVKQYNTDKKVVLITEDNMQEYVSFPPYILEKYYDGIITKTHMSDLLRAELLAKYGGVWMDATLLTFSPIPACFYDKPVYTGRCVRNKADYNISKNRWTTYFWVSRYPKNVLFCFLRDFWHAYWKSSDSLIEYFLIDYAIDLGYSAIPAIRKELDDVDMNGCGNDFWMLLKILQKDYNEQTMNLIQENNWMQKLSYKGEEHIQEKAINPEESFYKVLFLDNVTKSSSER